VKGGNLDPKKKENYTKYENRNVQERGKKSFLQLRKKKKGWFKNQKESLS